MIEKILTAFYRFFFRLLYHELAFTYNWVADFVSIGRWRQWICTTLPYLNGPRVLEIGHGPGHLLAQLHASGRIAVGLDASRQMSCFALMGLRGKGMEPLLVNGYAQRLPFNNSSFDQVAATFPTEYILNASTLHEIWRVLAPQGELIVLPVAWITGKGFLDRAAAWLFKATGQAPEWDESFLQPIRAAGFKVKTWRIQLESSEVLLLQAAKSGDSLKNI